MARIFINYRREDTRADAARLRERLVAVLGRSSVFMDIDDLKPGERFDQKLAEALEASNVFLAVIGSRWQQVLYERSQAGGRDYVREEIAAALRRGIMVIPVTIDRAPLPAEDWLPPDLKTLVLHQKHDVSYERFGRDVDELIQAIKAAPGAGRPWVPTARQLAGAAAALLLLGGAAMFMRPTGPIEPAPAGPGNTAPKSTPERRAACAAKVDFSCLEDGLVPGFDPATVAGLACETEQMVRSDEVKWKDIWTTSIYSYAPGGGGPGGGLANDRLRVGGFDDWYHSLIQFEVPKASRPVRAAFLLLHAISDSGTPVGMHLDRITGPWDWVADDRLWWRNKPTAAPLGQLPPPEAEAWYAIDVTKLAEDWLSGKSVNNGIQLRPVANNNHYSTFYSSRAKDPAKRPRLLICR